MKALAFLAILAIVMMPAATAQTSDSARVSVCATPYPVTATASIGAGFINFCVHYPPIVMPGSTFNVVSTFTAPPSLVPVFNTATGAFVNLVGCTEGTPNANPPTTNGVAGTMNAFTTTVTMTSEQCDAAASIAFTIGAVPLNIYLNYLPITVLTENVRMDIFDFLCDAPGIVPNAYSTTATTCNDPNVNNAVSGNLDVSICPETEPCFIESNATFSGNFTDNSNNTSYGDFERTFVNWFPIWMAVVMMFIAIYRPEGIEPNALLTSGILFWVGAIICPFGHWTDIVADVLRAICFMTGLWAILKWGDYRKPVDVRELA
jgi:hypothetical protein